MTANSENLALASYYQSGAYWQDRSDLLYYKYVDYIVRVVGAKATSIIDVGSGGSPYLEWFDWIEEKVSLDIQAPYSSDNVRGITADILSYAFERKFDLCLCLQVLEHVQDPTPFARRLFDLGETVIISVPYKWPAGKTKGHVQDPVDELMLEQWTGRRPNERLVVNEPLSGGPKRRRLICVYHPDPTLAWGREARLGRRLRKMGETC